MSADSPPFELSALENWRGLRPGMTRTEVSAVLAAAGLDSSAADEVEIDDWSMEIVFGTGGEKTLRQISAQGPEYRWKGKTVTGIPLHEAMSAMGDAVRRASWRPEDASIYALEDLGPLAAKAYTDEALLREGTAWFPALRIGISVSYGTTGAIVWRAPRDVPAEFAGPITEAQLQISARPDASDYLEKNFISEHARSHSKTTKATKTADWVLIWVCFAALVWVGTQGFLEKQRWRIAPIRVGTVLSIDGPEKSAGDRIFHVEYLDLMGRGQVAAIRGSEFYVAQRQVGEQVQLRILDGAPPRVMGLAGAENAAFFHYLPWGLAVGGFYVVGQLVIHVWSRLKKDAR
jgi:hypothetical protein